jgi:diguanylate cyclase (GGDEF)-like protein
LPPQEAVLTTRAASLAVPALLLSVAAGLAAARTLPDWLATTLRAAPLAVFVGGGLVGLLLRRGWVVLGLVVLALSDLALVQTGDRAVYIAIAILLPLNLGIIPWLGETPLLTTRCAWWLGVILAQASAVVVLRHPDLASFAGSLEVPLVASSFFDLTNLPHLSLVAFAVALALVLSRSLVGHRPLAVGTAWALVASFLALDGAGAGKPASVYLVIAGLLLVAGSALEPRRIAYLDGVTGLPGRLGLNAALRRLPRRYVLACAEIDDFRRFREEHGVDAGRRMLRLVADRLVKVGRGQPFYRDAQTFVVIFRRTSVAAAMRHMETFRRAVEKATLDIRVTDKPKVGAAQARPGKVERTVAVTVSIGIAQPARRGEDPDEVLTAAGRGVDRAKEAGMNRVVVV